jgi:protein SCO1/2
MTNPIRKSFAALSLAALCACQPAPGELTVTLYPTPDPLPAFELESTAGGTVDRRFFEGHWDLVFFGFTHCPDICPATLQRLTFARASLADRGISPLPRIVLVSVDPERDTPAVLRDYVEQFGDGVAGLTGNADAIRAFADALKIYYRRSSDDEAYSVDHSSVVLVVDPAARVRGLYSYPQDPAVIAAEYPVLIGM